MDKVQGQKGAIAMTREEFMKDARLSAHKILEGKENGIMNIVQQAWAEGKRNAEAETQKDAIEQALALHYGIPQNDEDCVLLYNGRKIKCKMGMIEYSDNAVPMRAVRKFEVYEV